MKEIKETSPCELGDVIEIPESTSVSHKKRNICRLVKMVIFIICCTAFGLQTTDFLTTFFSYPTVINVGIEKMDKFPTPALTFCSKYLYRFDKFCEKLNDDCEKKTTDFEKSCEEYNFKCIKNKTNIVTPRSFYDHIDDLVPSSTSEAFGYDKAGGFIGPFLQRNSGSQEVCYRWGTSLTPTGFRTTSVDSVMKFWKMYEISFNQSEYINFRDLEYGTLYVHSPLLSFHITSKSVTMKKNHNYKIHIRLEEELLLPSPYDTDCVDYIALWEKHNNSGPLSREMCHHNCMMRSEYFEEGDIPGCDERLFKISLKYGVYDANEINRERYKDCKCFFDCKDECLKLNYKLNFFEAPIEQITPEKVPPIVRIELYIVTPNVRVQSYKPKYMDVELFSYVGGFIGCWLGISLWSCTGIFCKGYSSFVTNIKAYKITLKGREKPSKQKKPSPGTSNTNLEA